MKITKRLPLAVISLLLVLSMVMPTFVASAAYDEVKLPEGAEVAPVPTPELGPSPGPGPGFDGLGITPAMLDEMAIDPQSWKLSRAMTWDEWNPNPVIDWVNEDEAPESRRVLRGALILVDFPDRKFIFSEAGSDLMSNPVVDEPVAYEDLADFWKDYLMTPSELNNYVTLDSYWRENTYGVQDVELESFGPYTLSRFEFQYSSLGITDVQRFRSIFPAGTGMATEAYNLAKASGDVEFFNDEGPAYDFLFFIHAGYDPFGLWHETGEMMFQTRQDIPYKYVALATVGFTVATD